MAIATFFALLIACYGCSYLIMHNLARLNSRSYFLLRLILLPGVVIHESAHALACIVTFTPIERISFWDEQGGHVLHYKPRLHLIAQPIISMAPLPIGMGLLLYLSQQLPASQWWVSLIILFLMMSIAGTLAPSKTDLGAALAGLVMIIIVGGGILAAFPSLIQNITPFFATLNQKLLLIFIILVITTVILAILTRAKHSLVTRSGLQP